MQSRSSRRNFLKASAALGACSALPALGTAQDAPKPISAGPSHPVCISSGNGRLATAKAIEMIKAGEDTLDAVIAGVNIVEDDPNDMSVGYGGLPNERCIVELDSCVMHGPSYNAGSVAAIQNIKNPSKVAKLVMTRTDHVMLVGKGALEFARAHGFVPQNLLTERARKAWLKWKENLSDRDDWLSEDEADKGISARPTGTINCLAVNPAGDLSGVTTTSGLAYKVPGRIGDSPIISAGLYVDNAAGAAGATGRGEAVILSGGSRIVCENMRRGLDPKDAIRDVLQRIADQTVDPGLLDEKGRPAFQVTFYALRKDGAYASGAIWGGKKFAVNDEKGNRHEDCIYLYEK